MLDLLMSGIVGYLTLSVAVMVGWFAHCLFSVRTDDSNSDWKQTPR